MIEEVSAQNKRIDYIDAIRGFAMICIIIGHFMFNPIVHNAIFTFHVPLFFALSGMFFHQKKDRTKRTLLKLIKPYVFTSVILLSGNVAISIANRSGINWWGFLVDGDGGGGH